MDRLVPVSDRCWAYVRAGGWGEANALLVVGDGASALIDTPWDTRVTADLLASIAPHLEDAPLTDAVNTHADGDHWWGNAALPDSTRIVTSDGALSQMVEEPGPGRIGVLTGFGRVSALVPGSIGRASRYLCRIFDGVHRPSTTRLPEATFSDATTLEVGGRALALVDDGPAHTAGDVVVTVEDAGVVAMGDLLFVDSTPLLWHGPLANWTQALDRVLALEPDVVVPGHGPVAEVADVRLMRDYWAWVETDARRHFDAGRTPLEAGLAMLTSPDAWPWLDWQHPDRLGVSLHTLWREWRGDPLHPPTTSDRLAAFADAEALRQRVTPV